MEKEKDKGAKALTDGLSDGDAQRLEAERLEAERLEAERLEAERKAAEVTATAWETQAAALPAWQVASLRIANGWVIGQPVAPADFAAALERIKTEVVR